MEHPESHPVNDELPVSELHGVLTDDSDADPDLISFDTDTLSPFSIIVTAIIFPYILGCALFDWIISNRHKPEPATK